MKSVPKPDHLGVRHENAYLHPVFPTDRMAERNTILTTMAKIITGNDYSETGMVNISDRKQEQSPEDPGWFSSYE